MRRYLLVILISLVAGAAGGVGGAAVYEKVLTKSDPGVYCFDTHPDDVFDDTQDCVPKH